MKRALIVYHSFDEWEMGPIRIRRIARNLARHGYEPVVLTSPVTSRSTGTVPDHIEIIRAKAVDLAELYQRIKPSSRDDKNKPVSINRSIGLTSTINRWFMVPDKQITWRKPAVAAARAYLRDHPVDVIFGSLAPRTNLLVARQLARELNLPCVQEFRDLWTGSPYYHLAQPTACCTVACMRGLNAPSFRTQPASPRSVADWPIICKANTAGWRENRSP
jgi:hypothetical protein